MEPKLQDLEQRRRLSVLARLSPFYRYCQRAAHEKPVIFWSVLIGFAGPILMGVVPPIRMKFGWRPPPPIPTSYPLPERARRPVQGYDDE